MIYSENPTFCITYKVGQQDLSIHKRKFIFTNRVVVDKESHSNYYGIDCKSMNCFIIASNKKIFVYQYESFKKINELDLSVIMRQGNKNVILNMKLSKKDQFLAVLVG